MRKNFITNRISLLRGKYNSTDFKSDDRIITRWSAPKKTEGAQEGSEQEKINKSIDAVPPTGDFSFTSIKTGYAGV
jgi:hypothetical protein